MTRDWVIGRGLLGSAVARRTASEPIVQHVRWSERAHAEADLREGLRRLYEDDAEAYTLYWCAGSGVTSTPAEVLREEAEVFGAFLAGFAEVPDGLRSRTTVFLASSVGGAYAGVDDPPYSESSPVAPASPYGETKLSMEDSLRTAVAEHGLHGFVGRITNLYGPGQKLGKRQGLISVLCETYVRREPVTVYVSLDTLRDYIYEDDCAAVVVAGTDRARDIERGATVTKIIGAGTAVSIGELIGTITRVRRHRPLVAFGGGDARGQASDLRVRSEVWTDLQGLVQTSLPAGIAAVLRSLGSAAASGNA
ncbi:NAD-dependent epimerase/dehydratase family protein [Microbacterium sp. NPDC056569]|uniref:NAD-dependent epimerase/dehydratase family protein n=1 Tax=Microbacterium sp. NPDC056569 TaxID=3345867 RepID=UPI00366BBC3A